MVKMTRSAGFTLVEMVVTAGLLGMLSVGITSVLLVSIRSSAEANAQADVKTQGDHAASSMERLIRNATGMPVCNSPDNTQIQFSMKDAFDESVTHDYTYQYATGLPGRITLNDSVAGSLGNVVGSSVHVNFAEFECGSNTVTLNLELAPMSNPTKIQQFRTTVAIRNIPR